MSADRETPITALEAARQYQARGWWLMLARPGEKAPSLPGRPNLRLGEQDLGYFSVSRCVKQGSRRRASARRNNEDE